MLTRPLSDRVRAGLGWGIGYAIILSLWAVVVALTGGWQPLASHGLTLPAVVAIYVLGGLTGGVLVGIGLPLLRTQVGACVLGAVAMAPAYGLTGLAVGGLRPLTWYHLIMAVGMPALVGGPLGLVYRELFLARALADERKQMRHVRKEALKAMHRGDYVHAVQIYQSFRGPLPRMDRRRLAEAQRRAQLAP